MKVYTWLKSYGYAEDLESKRRSVCRRIGAKMTEKIFERQAPFFLSTFLIGDRIIACVCAEKAQINKFSKRKFYVYVHMLFTDPKLFDKSFIVY